MILCHDQLREGIDGETLQLSELLYRGTRVLLVLKHCAGLPLQDTHYTAK